jgi:hypothetical protein
MSCFKNFPFRFVSALNRFISFGSAKVENLFEPPNLFQSFIFFMTLNQFRKHPFPHYPFNCFFKNFSPFFKRVAKISSFLLQPNLFWSFLFLNYTSKISFSPFKRAFKTGRQRYYPSFHFSKSFSLSFPCFNIVFKTPFQYLKNYPATTSVLGAQR